MDIANPVPLHTSLLNDYVQHNAFDDDDDEYISDYIELILFTIVTNMECHKVYLKNPSLTLYNEIQAHSGYIATAESSLNVHI